MPRSSRIAWRFAGCLCAFMFVFLIVPGVALGDLRMILSALGWLAMSAWAFVAARGPRV